MTHQPSLQGGSESTQALTPLQDYLLDKLTRFLKQRESYLQDPRHDATLLKVLDRSIYVTYLDCLNQGIDDLARARVDEYRTQQTQPKPAPSAN